MQCSFANMSDDCVLYECKMKKSFRVHVKDSFDAVFDTIEQARACRKALKRLDYKNIIISVTTEDVNPYKK